MRKRDKSILDDIIRFRCMSRDDIKDLYFKHLKNPIGNCNAVLKRMYLQGLIDRNTNMQPYIYFPKEKPIKKDSAKIPHFLEIVKVYKDMISYTKPTMFLVEPKYGKGYMEPDIFTIWKGAPLWIEVQRSHYTDEVMNEKIARYEAFYASGLIKGESWQPKDYPVFPSILIISPVRYPVTSEKIQIMQAKSIKEFMMTVDKPRTIQSKGVTIKVGG
jgi:hypothetical protein